MQIRIASDLHLEFFRSAPVGALMEHFLPEDSRDANAVLVLAGDISADPTQLLEFLQRAEARFLAVIYVPGNHEYYRHDYSRWNEQVRGWKDKLTCTHIAAGTVATYRLNGVTFVFGTLWADGGPDKESRARVGNGLADFSLIRCGSRAFTVEDMRREHRNQREAFAKCLRDEPDVRVGVSHHLPSYSLCHPRFGDWINGGFASDSDHLLDGPAAPALWIHGHTHDTLDATVGRTRVVCNPAGYRPEWGSQFNDYFAAPKFYEVAVTAPAPTSP